MSNKTFNPSKPVQTRDGLPVRIICSNVFNPNYPIAALVRSPDGTEKLETYTADGAFRHDQGCTKHPRDLVNPPFKITMNLFVNCYPGNVFSVYNTRADADKAAIPNGRIACLAIVANGEEGEGL